MKKILEFNGIEGPILVEVTEIQREENPRQNVSLVKNIISKTTKTIDDLLVSCVKTVIGSAYRILSESLENKPDEIEMKFGIKFTSEADVMIANVSNECNFEITLKWKTDRALA